MVCAAFRHERSRPVNGKSDMRLHTHYYLINATWDGAEKRWKAAQLGEVKSKAPDLQLHADALLGKKLRELGYAPVMGSTVACRECRNRVLDKFSQNNARIEGI